MGNPVVFAILVVIVILIVCAIISARSAPAHAPASAPASAREGYLVYPYLDLDEPGERGSYFGLTECP